MSNSNGGTGRLAGKVAFVTGAGGGIGAATVRRFVEEGAWVALVDNDGDAVRRAASEIDPTGETVLALEGDLAVEAECERLVADTVARWGRLDILANVAGVRVYGPITEATPESWEFIIGVNLLATAYCAKFAIPEMAKNGGGAIVNVSSLNGLKGRAGMAQYDATKGAVLSLTRSLACDHAKDNIRVNCVLPGPTLTMFHVRRRATAKNISLEEAEAEIRDEPRPYILLGRQAEPVEIANAILFLASDEASYITGTMLNVDGGLGV